MKNFDFLVIGSGVAGMLFALKAAKYGSVAIVTKKSALDSNTAWAQGGISAVVSQLDSIDEHVADTLDAGAGLCNAAVVRSIAARGAEAIASLEEYGVEFDRVEGQYDLGMEGGHSKRRILHAKDATGMEIASKLLQAVRKEAQITLFEQHFAIDLITTTRLGMLSEDRVLGAYVLDTASGEVEIFRSDRVLLASGGCGKVYLYTTNPDGASGDGVAMAWRAGAAIANMEFIQFHPTCFYNPGATDALSRSFLISEAVRGEGGVLINDQGEQFVYQHDARGSLAPRDIVARAIDFELKKSGKPCVYVDITKHSAEYLAKRFPTIYQTCLQAGIDASKQPIPVVPAAHYQCGGVQTNADGQSSLRGLYAAGEVACTGLHGANRLASNSLLEGVVVPLAALQSMLRQIPIGRSVEQIHIPAWQHGDTSNADELVVITHNWDEIRRLMWDYVSIVRTTNRLKRAATRLHNLHKEVREFYWGYRVNADILELRNLVTVASLIVDCALRRPESRGLHYTLNFPSQDPRYANIATSIRRS